MKSRTDNDIKNKWYSMQRTQKIRKRKAAEHGVNKRTLKKRMNERQEIVDLISLSKALDAQDENQANTANDAHDFDDLQPYPPHHQAQLDSQDIWHLVGLIATETSEV